MRAVFVLFDSLNRLILNTYGGRAVATPHFDRLAARAVTFDRHYVGSLPCMPARRDMQTGRLSFLHRSWGPLEPFDNAFPEILHQAGIYSHLVTDHYHYFEDGGATYHTRYDSFEFVRGQEADPWVAMVQPAWDRLRARYDARQFGTGRRNLYAQNVLNREALQTEEDYPSVRCFSHGLDFLRRNRDADGWLLQIETFDPHEPFTAPPRYRQAFPTAWKGAVRDWPRYGRVDELPAECEELRANYYAMIALCDAQLGRLLDVFDADDLWADTALIVTTDHGFLLGEHDFWAKNRMNLYEEIVHIPLLVAHPGAAAQAGQRRAALTQTIDLAPTFLDLFGVAPPPEMQGHSLLPLLGADVSPRMAALFGYFGGAVNVTDGRHTYHRYPADLAAQSIHQYTLMPTHLNTRFTAQELQDATLAPPFSFTRGMPTLKVKLIPDSPMYRGYGPGALLEKTTRLYDLGDDPGQEHPLSDPATEARMAAFMARLMRENDAPPEAFARLDLPIPA